MTKSQSSRVTDHLAYVLASRCKSATPETPLNGNFAASADNHMQRGIMFSTEISEYPSQRDDRLTGIIQSYHEFPFYLARSLDHYCNFSTKERYIALLLTITRSSSSRSAIIVSVDSSQLCSTCSSHDELM